MAIQKIDLIRQALSASESSIKLARQLLSDLEKDAGGTKSKAKELPGTSGMFDGQNMVSEKGDEKFPVPENYASKSILVVGDTLKLVETDGEKRFKQIEHVKRHKTTGILAKKEGKWVAVTPEGWYKVLPASISHYNGDVGDEALLQLPANNLQVPWAAVEKITKKGTKEIKASHEEAIKAMPAGRQETKPARIASQSDAGGEKVEVAKEEETGANVRSEPVKEEKKPVEVKEKETAKEEVKIAVPKEEVKTQEKEEIKVEKPKAETAKDVKVAEIQPEKSSATPDEEELA